MALPRLPSPYNSLLPSRLSLPPDQLLRAASGSRFCSRPDPFLSARWVCAFRLLFLARCISNFRCFVSLLNAKRLAVGVGRASASGRTRPKGRDAKLGRSASSAARAGRLKGCGGVGAARDFSGAGRSRRRRVWPSFRHWPIARRDRFGARWALMRLRMHETSEVCSVIVW